MSDKLARVATAIYTEAQLIPQDGQVIVVINHRTWSELGDLLEAPVAPRRRRRARPESIDVITTPTIPMS